MGEIKPILQRNYDEWSASQANLPSTSKPTASGRTTPIPEALQAGLLSPRARAHIPERLQPAIDKALTYVPPSAVQRTQSGLHFFASRPTPPDDRDTQAIASLLANDFSDWKPQADLNKRPSIMDLAHQSEQGYTPSKIRPPAFQYPTLKPANQLPVYQPVLPPLPRYDGMPISSRPLLPEKVDPLAISANDSRAS